MAKQKRKIFIHPQHDRQPHLEKIPTIQCWKIKKESEKESSTRFVYLKNFYFSVDDLWTDTRKPRECVLWEMIEIKIRWWRRDFYVRINFLFLVHNTCWRERKISGLDLIAVRSGKRWRFDNALEQVFITFNPFVLSILTSTLFFWILARIFFSLKL